MMRIRFLKAFNGDCIQVSFKDPQKNDRNILIDVGTPDSYHLKNAKQKQESGEFKVLIKEINEKQQLIDLLILTHIDDDHIGGILRWFENDPQASKTIGRIWFNSGRLIAGLFNIQGGQGNSLELRAGEGTDTSVRQGVIFEDYIEKNELWEKRLICNRQVIEKFGLTFRILSPDRKKLELLLDKWEKESPGSLTSGKTNDYDLSLKEHVKNDRFKEDTAVHNGSSIAFILTWQGKNLLFLGDAHPGVVVDSLLFFGYSKQHPLDAELVKVSHHGSKANTNDQLLQMIRSDKFIISSNGNKHNLPDKQFLARLINIHKNCEIYFNYPDMIEKIFKKGDYDDFPDFRVFPAEDEFEISI